MQVRIPELPELTRSVPGLDTAVREVIGGTRSVARTGRRSAGLVGRLPALLAEAVATVADAGEHRTRRRMWARNGKAHIEVRGLTGGGDAYRKLCYTLTAELRQLRGVDWAAVNAVTGQVLIAFDEDDIGVDTLLEVVEAVEETRGTDTDAFLGSRPHHPFETAPAMLAGASLVTDCLGMVVAATGRLTPLPRFPRYIRVPLVLVDTQPRLRRAVESWLGETHTDTVLAMANAVLHAMTAGVAPLGVDAAQRVLQLAEIRSRQEVWNRREAELVPPGGGLPQRTHEPEPRPEPLPPGPVERGSERTALAGAVAAAGLLAMTREPSRAAEVVLATAPKAARVGRETFAALVARDLARRGVVPMNGTAYRRLDRVSAVVIDSVALCTSRLRLLSAVTTGDLDEPELWGLVHSLLAGRPLSDLAGEGPWSYGEWRLERARDAKPGRPDGASALVLDLFDADGRRQGRVHVGCELDPLADALVGAARAGADLLVLTEHASTATLLPWADEVLPQTAVAVQEVRRLQADGHGVLLIASGDEDALAAADVGIALLQQAGGGVRNVSWSADLLCGPGLAEAWRVLRALGEARRTSAHSARLASGGAVLGALLAGVGSPRRPLGGRITSPVYGAATAALLVGAAAARRVAREPLPPPRPHGVWHSLGAREAYVALIATPQRDQDRPRREQPAPPGGSRLRRAAGAALRSPVAAVAVLPARRAGSLLAAVREELRDPLTPVLALGAAASAVVGSNVDAILVAGVMVGNALISAGQRLRAERALRGLLLSERVTARRVHWTPQPDAEAAGSGEPGKSGEWFFAGLEIAAVETVTAEDLLPGDMIALGPSDVVPADARLVTAIDLEIDEASLTGESVPVAKQTRPTPGADLADRTSMVYEGCTVLAGSGFAVVVATGAQTQAGLAADVASSAGTPAGIEGHLAQLTRIALPATALGGTAVTLLALLRRAALREALASGVAIAVAAVPEGLPLVATVAQSAAARRLSRQGVLVRSARVLEALGRVDVVCFDKTGTLTEGRLSVARTAGFDRETPLDSALGRRVLRTAARACPRQETGGRALAHATDRAIVDAAAAHGIDDSDWHLVDELAFETSRGYSASLGMVSGKPFLAVKGAPETVLRQCATTLATSSRQSVLPFTPARRRAAGALLHRLASDGLRVLAVAESQPDSLDVPEDTGVAGLVTDLTLTGFVAIADTVRPGAAEAVRRLAEAGVRVTMVTGDHPTTAAAIARQLGIPEGRVLTGAELDALTERERVTRTAKSTVFARVSPEQKIRIVQALQRAGHVVAMAGDGTNDAAAIRVADVGIGVSARGSTSARTAADLVLTDPDLARLIDALLEGRTLWDNVRNAVAILVGGNAGEVAFTVLGTALTGRTPLSTRQLLLVNMLTDMLPALAVALAPAKPSGTGGDRLTQGPVTSLLGPGLTRILAVRGTATALGAMAAFQLGRMTGRSRRASTMGLAALVGTQLGQTLITDWHSPAVLATSAVSTLMLAAIIETPVVSHFFGCTPLGPVAGGIAVICAATATAGAALAPRLFLRGPGPDPARS
ncbi:cation-translocating P-type ATPase [Actinacidiphila oryziradicis]|uniref:cation-translocating P-type ATPase n=1 Tax=Actinacidiphila oryziradicis TaxID=2571141 RepID=UPI0023EFDF4A|nr:cation-translocating P-type ATPase [Actinacidiphila oryziradicis]MCW2872050.1 cation-translocating P-type ATPase [Actinacidiphila oryziradicis]